MVLELSKAVLLKSLGESVTSFIDADTKTIRVFLTFSTVRIIVIEYLMLGCRATIFFEKPLHPSN